MSFEVKSFSDREKLFQIDQKDYSDLEAAEKGVHVWLLAKRLWIVVNAHVLYVTPGPGSFKLECLDARCAPYALQLRATSKTGVV